jgi:hypothetical protein
MSDNDEESINSKCEGSKEKTNNDAKTQVNGNETKREK